VVYGFFLVFLCVAGNARGVAFGHISSLCLKCLTKISVAVKAATNFRQNNFDT